MEYETKMRRFILVRNEDETGISGTGVVAEGTVFWDGTCVIKWLTDTSSIGIYKSHVEMIHLHGHQGRTVIKWIDEKKEEKKEEEKLDPVVSDIPASIRPMTKSDNVMDTDKLEAITKQLVKVSENSTGKVIPKDDDGEEWEG